MALANVASDILLNFDVIGNITTHQTLMVEGNRLGFEVRYAQFVRRHISGDGRKQIRDAIEKTFTICEELLHSYQCNTYVLNFSDSRLHQEQAMIVTNIRDTLKQIMERRTSVIEGLETLSTFERYNYDPEFKIQMERFKERMQKVCKWAESIQRLIAL